MNFARCLAMSSATAKWSYVFCASDSSFHRCSTPSTLLASAIIKKKTIIGLTFSHVYLFKKYCQKSEVSRVMLEGVKPKTTGLTVRWTLQSIRVNVVITLWCQTTAINCKGSNLLQDVCLISSDLFVLLFILFVFVVAAHAYNCRNLQYSLLHS